ncbi:hypothetical protein EDD85DRAFT_958297 [Armillaria nabsnona]|nr:hypothetical protein EDD85DRAFT_958297 [Armillaria nabsnona]
MKKQLEELQHSVTLDIGALPSFGFCSGHCECTLTLSLDFDGALLFIGPRRADSSAAHDSHFPALPAFAVPNDLGLAPLFDPQSRKWEQHAVPVVRTHQRLAHVFVPVTFSNDECVSLDEEVATQPQPSGSELSPVGAVELASALSRIRPASGANTSMLSSKQITANSHYTQIPAPSIPAGCFQQRRSTSSTIRYQFLTALPIPYPTFHPSLEHWPND